MRGSVYYQSSQLVKQIFEEGASKEERINPNHDNYKKVASYQTMESYRNIWNNFFNYLLEHWKIKNFENIEAHHIAAYMDYKIEYYPSKQYLEKISSSLGKLEIALIKFAKNIHNKNISYDFSIRQLILNEARDLKLVANNYHNRAYNNPDLLISKLKDPLHRLAAKIQYEGGFRIEGVAFIKVEQLLSIKLDIVTNTQKGVLSSTEKGGKYGQSFLSLDTYNELKEYFNKKKIFRINRQLYYKDIKQAALIANEVPEASHGLRWNFAKRRLYECGIYGYSYEESLQCVSFEMKHNRAIITQHYML